MTMKALNVKGLRIAILFLVITTFWVWGCNDENLTNPPDPNDQELITTLRLEFTDSASGATSTFEFDDPDGEGGNPPVRFDSIRIDNSKTYDVNVVLLNKSTNPADTISNEVKEEGDEHQFFYTVAGANIQISYNDTDVNGNPIGLKTIWRAGSSSSGTVKVVLKHQPGSKAPAPGNPDIGETDVSVDFQSFVQ